MIITDKEVLKQTSRPATQEDMDRVVPKLIDALNRGWVGAIALSAIQIGEPVQIFIYVPNMIDPLAPKIPVPVMNAKIIGCDGLNFKGQEGCLSIPHKRFGTYRYNEVTVIEDGRKTTEKTYRGLLAQVYQHEIDHGNGILCSERTIIQGRNQRCDCGSNLKFKKCHGK